MGPCAKIGPGIRMDCGMRDLYAYGVHTSFVCRKTRFVYNMPRDGLD